MVKRRHTLPPGSPALGEKNHLAFPPGLPVDPLHKQTENGRHHNLPQKSPILEENHLSLPPGLPTLQKRHLSLPPGSLANGHHHALPPGSAISAKRHRSLPQGSPPSGNDHRTKRKNLRVNSFKIKIIENRIPLLNFAL